MSLPPASFQGLFESRSRAGYDLLDPALGGKIQFPDVMANVAVYTYMGLRKVIAVSYFEVCSNRTLLTLDHSVDYVQKLVQGEILVAIYLYFSTGAAGRRRRVRRFGVYYPKEGVVRSDSPMRFWRRRLHPNVSKPFYGFPVQRRKGWRSTRTRMDHSL